MRTVFIVAIVASAVIMLAAVGVIVWYFAYRKTTAEPVIPVVTPAPKARVYKASAAVGDFLEVSVLENKLTYTNKTNGVSGTDVVMTVDSLGFATFGDDPNLALAIEVEDSTFMFHTKTAGPGANKEGFALGLSVEPYIVPQFPPRLFNYMQFRTNNGGFEVGFIDATTSTLTHQTYGPSQCYGQGEDGKMHTGAIADGVGNPSSFPLDAGAFTMSEDKTYLSKTFPASEREPENTITMFKTKHDDLVIDMANGSIFAMAALADDTLPIGSFTGLLFGRDDAVADQNNTETGTDLLTKHVVVFTAGGNFTWAEDGVTRFSGVAVPLNTLVTMDADRKMHGVFTCRIVNSTQTTDLVFGLGGDGKLLCGAYTNTSGEQAYGYRHGACKKL